MTMTLKPGGVAYSSSGLMPQMTCVYCGRRKQWTGPELYRHPVKSFMFGGEGEFPQRLYAICWGCWERDHLRSAIAWAARPWFRRIGKRWT